MIDILRIIAAFAVVAGSLFGLLAAVGLVRFPDLYTRLHAASKAGAVGAGLILIGLAIVSFDAAVILRSIIAILFVLLTTPISAHLLARAGYMTGVKLSKLTKTNEMP
jgi:multicomponent Na+:H+ antiporter subunit G